MIWRQLTDAWPVLSGLAAFTLAVWRWDFFRLLLRSWHDRLGMALENAELRKRFALESERGDYWEDKCDELERQFRAGLAEIGKMRSAIKMWRQRLLDLIVDREAALTWGIACAETLEQHGIPPPMERPRFILTDVNILDPLPKETE